MLSHVLQSGNRGEPNPKCQNMCTVRNGVLAEFMGTAKHQSLVMVGAAADVGLNIIDHFFLGLALHLPGLVLCSCCLMFLSAFFFLGLLSLLLAFLILIGALVASRYHNTGDLRFLLLWH